MLEARAQRARRILAAFLITFLTTRVLVFFIMTRRLPDLYVFVGQTHVHHLNFGIILLSIVGGYLLLVPAASGQIGFLSVLYGIGLGLTFDEFGMWFHLGGGYWQRASYDAIIAITSVLTLTWLAPPLRYYQARHWAISVVILIFFMLFTLLLAESLQLASRHVTHKFERLDEPDSGTP